jgi:phosphatidylserine/phosphatidylglycerophosphate/cardiolipin synthase-like enzyme
MACASRPEWGQPETRKFVLGDKMGKIVSAKAYANNEVSLIAWQVDGMIDHCLGFDIRRIRVDGSEPPKPLPAWVPFPGQDNKDWKPQNTGVWPVQKLYWRDLTLRQHRDKLQRREIGFAVKYLIRPVGDLHDGLEPVPEWQPKDYDGPERRLGYLGQAVETNEITIQLDFDGVRATFTNGILSGQWLKRTIESKGAVFNKKTVADEIAKPTSDIRKYLTGDVLDTVTLFLNDDKYKNGNVRLALYELKDDELVDLLIKNKRRIEVILSNTSKNATGWDGTNQPARKRLHKEGVKVHDRMFNNNHIGHNKFAVFRDGKQPKVVMTGSTNWTSTGLCGQSNNAFILQGAKIAQAYDEYWQRLFNDKFPSPRPVTHAGTVRQCQGPDIRTKDETPLRTSSNKIPGIEIWYSPNTEATRKGEETPPDLKVLFELMMKAKEAIFFLAFLPSREGANSIIAAAMNAAERNESLIVAGAISDPSAMPGYRPGNKKKGIKSVEPYTHDANGLHIVRAAALNDVVGAFEKELLKVGQAIVHDKIVVIDPLSEDCVVAAGSHNLGFKASYENDENLVIFRGSQALAQAYAVHVIDVYDHYRFRAWQAKEKEEGKPTFQGFIDGDDRWLRPYAKLPRRDIAEYFAEAQGR